MNIKTGMQTTIRAMAIGLLLAMTGPLAHADVPGTFHLEEATITQIQQAIAARQLTSQALVNLYLKRIKAYDGTCVKQPQGILGPIQTIPNAGQINSLVTLNLRPATLKKWGFDPRKARSLTDKSDVIPLRLRHRHPPGLRAAAAASDLRVMITRA